MSLNSGKIFCNKSLSVTRFGTTIALVISNILIFSEIFNLPVYWPFLLVYFIFLVFVTIKRQKRHMEKYGYSFIDFGKNKKSGNVKFQKDSK